MDTTVSNVKEISVVNAQPKAKRKQTPLFWQLLRKAKNTFEKQLDKDNKIKLRCVERVIGADAPDIEKFWLTYKDQVDALLDSKRFEKQCRNKGLIPEIVAEHIVYQGNGTVKRVRAEGIDCLGNEVCLYKEPFTDGKLNATPATTSEGDSTVA